MFISVCVCTWNRSAFLRQTLDDLTRVVIPPGVDWEVIVVDNNSTDDTKQTVDLFSARLPIQYHFEPHQGIANARNTAFERSRGELILWADDDVRLEPSWVRSYVEAAARWPKAAFFGGRIDPAFEVPPPHWARKYLKRLEGVFIIRDFGEVERPFEGYEEPFSANIAFRRAALERVRFDPDLGLKGSERMLGEESAVTFALRAADEIGVWVPSAKVTHFVPQHRLKKPFVRSCFFYQGRTSFRMQGRPGIKPLPMSLARLRGIYWAFFPLQWLQWCSLRFSIAWNWLRGVLFEARFCARA